MEHVISIEEFHSRKVERKEAGESSRDNDQPVTVARDTQKLTITIQERGSTSSKKEKFKKLKEAHAKVQLGTTPKIRENHHILMLRGHKHYQKYCEPRVVSLGPIHHGKPEYQLTEEYKLLLADKFIDQTGRTDEELYAIIENNIERLRGYYDEKVTQKYSDEDLAWILFVDGCATLQVIDLVVKGTVKDVKIKSDLVPFVEQDLFLLENQLPYQLFDCLVANTQNRKRLKTSIQTFINMHSMIGEDTESPYDEDGIHLLDLLRKRLLGPTNKIYSSSKRSKHKKMFSRTYWYTLRNVQDLKAAGIRLNYSYNANLGNIVFIRNWKFYGGVLRLPPITVDESTGPKFFNLIAYEMSPDFENDYGVTSYISFLNSLIHEAKDVMHLRQAGILRNLLGSDDEVAQVFNEIGTGLVPNPAIYRDVGYKIEKYYSDQSAQIWIFQALYIQAYSGAVLGLTFSLVQMIYAMLSYEYQRRH